MLYVSLDNADTVIEGGPHQRGSISAGLFLTVTENNWGAGGAPLLALFEKWPAEQLTPFDSAFERSQAAFYCAI